MAGLLFWLMIGVAGVLFAFGLKTKSWKALLWSGVTIFLPSLYFLGAENWFRILALVPLVPIGFAYFINKKNSQNEG